MGGVRTGWVTHFIYKKLIFVVFVAQNFLAARGKQAQAWECWIQDRKSLGSGVPKSAKEIIQYVSSLFIRMYMYMPAYAYLPTQGPLQRRALQPIHDSTAFLHFKFSCSICKSVSGVDHVLFQIHQKISVHNKHPQIQKDGHIEHHHYHNTAPQCLPYVVRK